MKKGGGVLLAFFAGLALMAAGIYWFMSSVTVTTGFYSMTIGGFRAGGLVVVPFIIGIVWLFFDSSSFGAKIVAGLGLLIILASVIMGTTFNFKQRNLYEYAVMLVCIFGGLGLVLKALFGKTKE